MQLGFVGTGTMGGPMVRCLLEAGHQVTVYDRRREAAEALCTLGARWADSPRAVAQSSEVVFTSLPGPPEVEHVLLDPVYGILGALHAGGAYIDTTTNAPTMVRQLAAACQERGVAMLDAPVSSRPPRMTMMVGGAAATFATYRHLLDCMGRDVFYVGDIGSGCTAKLVTQYLGYANFIAAAEGLVIAAKAGLDLRVLAQIIPVSAGASRAFDTFHQAVFDGTFTSGGTLDIVAKDLSLACELARDVQAPSRIGSIVEEVLKRGQAQGWGQEGYAIAVRVLEQMAGVELRPPSSP